MTPARLEQMLRSTAKATALAVALSIGSAALAPLLPGLASSANATTERDFTEENVIAATEKVVGERSRDVLEAAAIRLVIGHGTILAAPPALQCSTTSSRGLYRCA